MEINLLTRTMNSTRPRELRFTVPLRQKIGDGFILLITFLINVLFFFFVGLFALLFVFPHWGSDRLFTMTLFLAVTLTFVAFYRYTPPWWSLEINANRLRLKTFKTLILALKDIQFVHAGHYIGMQSPEERRHSVPLTLELSSGQKERIFLRPSDAQTCINHMTAHCAWIGGVSVDGETILPREPKATMAILKRASRFYLYSGIPMTLLGLVGLIVALSKGSALWHDSDNPITALYQLSAIPLVLGYGIWALAKYAGLLKSQTPARGRRKG